MIWRHATSLSRDRDVSIQSCYPFHRLITRRPLSLTISCISVTKKIKLIDTFPWIPWLIYCKVSNYNHISSPVEGMPPHQHLLHLGRMIVTKWLHKYNPLPLPLPLLTLFLMGIGFKLSGRGNGKINNSVKFHGIYQVLIVLKKGVKSVSYKEARGTFSHGHCLTQYFCPSQYFAKTL